MNTQDWRKCKNSMERATWQQCEWFRLALKKHCDEREKGIKKEAALTVGYSWQGGVTNLLAGTRIPVLSKAAALAFFFGRDLISFLSEGRDLSTGSSDLARLEAHRMLDDLIRADNRDHIDMVMSVLRLCSAQQASAA